VWRHWLRNILSKYCTADLALTREPTQYFGPKSWNSIYVNVSFILSVWMLSSLSFCWRLPHHIIAVFKCFTTMNPLCFITALKVDLLYSSIF
jgi:hypothetical protein